MSDSQNGERNFVFNEKSYKKSKDYWSTVDPTVDGMLGGFSHVSIIDIDSSKKFLSQYFSRIDGESEDNDPRKLENVSRKKRRCLDCGAGIGRVTKHLLLKFFDCVDLLEQNEAFLKKAEDYIGKDIYAKRIGKLYACSLHQFQPDLNVEYDVIWFQWASGYLTDDDFVEFLKKCKLVLNKENGMIIIKENHTSSDECDPDTKDCSVTRPYWLLKEIFNRAGLEVVCERKQYKFPKGLYPVKMFALK